MKFRTLTLCISLSLSSSACIPVIIGAGAAAGAYVSVQERGAKTAVIDTEIKVRVKETLTNKNYQFLTAVGVNVLEGRVMLTGVVGDQATKDNLGKVVSEVQRVKEVYNELIVKETYTAKEKANDVWIATQFKTRMLASKDVYSINYLTDVINGNLYILGLTQSSSETERVLHLASTTKGVKQVFNYLTVVNAENAEEK